MSQYEVNVSPTQMLHPLQLFIIPAFLMMFGLGKAALPPACESENRQKGSAQTVEAVSFLGTFSRSTLLRRTIQGRETANDLENLSP